VDGRSLRSGRLSGGSAYGCRLRRSLWTGEDAMLATLTREAYGGDGRYHFGDLSSG